MKSKRDESRAELPEDYSEKPGPLKKLLHQIKLFFELDGIWTPGVRISIVVILSFLFSVAIYFILGDASTSELLNILLTIDLAFFALQIAVFTLMVAPYKTFQGSIRRKKRIYIEMIENDRSKYDEGLYAAFDTSLRQNHKKFRFSVYEMFFLLIEFALCMLLVCIPAVPLRVKVTALFSSLIRQFSQLFQFMGLLISLSLENKKVLWAEIDFSEERLMNTIKYKNAKKDKKELAELVYLVEKQYDEKFDE